MRQPAFASWRAAVFRRDDRAGRHRHGVGRASALRRTFFPPAGSAARPRLSRSADVFERRLRASTCRVRASRRPSGIARTNTVWFEGPPMARPASQQGERTRRTSREPSASTPTAPLGTRYWRVSTSQGTTPLKKFVVGELPEVVEDEIDGDPIPTAVTPARHDQRPHLSPRGCRLVDVRGRRR